MNFTIRKARVSPPCAQDPWWAVLHPVNGAVLAYCNTEAEAESVVRALDRLGAELDPLPNAHLDALDRVARRGLALGAAAGIVVGLLVGLVLAALARVPR